MEITLSRFKGKLVKIIKDSGGKLDDNSISPKIRQILLHWGYELKKEDLLQFSLIKLFIFYFFYCIEEYYFLLHIRRFNHMTKSRIFKNLNLRKKADRNFRGTFLKKRFRHLKLYSNPPSWLARNRYHMGFFWKTKDWSSHFWESQPFRFWYVEVHRQRRLKLTKTGICS